MALAGIHVRNRPFVHGVNPRGQRFEVRNDEPPAVPVVVLELPVQTGLEQVDLREEVSFPDLG